MKSRTLTLKQLRDANACRQQVDRFSALVGDHVDVTEALCVKHASDFDFRFAAKHFLSVAAWAEYDRVSVAAWAEYDRVSAPAWAEYDRVSVAAWAEYDRVSAPAWAEYDRDIAAAFGRLYVEDVT